MAQGGAAAKELLKARRAQVVEAAVDAAGSAAREALLLGGQGQPGKEWQGARGADCGGSGAVRMRVRRGYVGMVCLTGGVTMWYRGWMTEARQVGASVWEVIVSRPSSGCVVRTRYWKGCISYPGRVTTSGVPDAILVLTRWKGSNARCQDATHGTSVRQFQVE